MSAPGYTDCVGLWKMNDNDANADVKDYSGQSNDGTAQQNTDQISTAGIIKNALNFNGTSDYITVLDDPSFDTAVISISVWINTGTLSSDYASIINKEIGSGVDDEWSLLLDIGAVPKTIFFFVNDGDWQAAESTTTVGNNSGWIHIVAVKTSDTIKIYVDGSWEDDTAQGTMNNGTSNIIIGKYGDGASRYFAGKLDALMIFKKALSAEEIAWLYSNGNGRELASLTPMVHHYNMLGNN